MALSLLQHVRDMQHDPLAQRLVPDLGQQATEQLIEQASAWVLAHISSLNQRHGSALALALVNTRSIDGLWQTLDRAQAVHVWAAQLGVSTEQIDRALNPIAQAVLDEVHELSEAASLGEDGLGELLQGQPSHLQGHAPDWIWHSAGLPELAGQAAVAEPEVIDLASGIASLTALMKQAQDGNLDDKAATTETDAPQPEPVAEPVQKPVKESPVATPVAQPTPVTAPVVVATETTPHHSSTTDMNTAKNHHTPADHAHADTNHAHSTELPEFAAAGTLSKLIAPLVALALLLLLIVLFGQNPRSSTLSMLEHFKATDASNVQPEKPMVMVDRSPQSMDVVPPQK